MKLHEFIYGLSGNPLIAPALDTHLTYTQRVMGEVLISDEKPRDSWDQHEAILKAIAKGDGERAEALMRSRLTQAAGFMVARLRNRAEASPAARASALSRR
jgi:DNA-binding GntR family transcriptional regulator